MAKLIFTRAKSTVDVRDALGPPCSACWISDARCFSGGHASQGPLSQKLQQGMRTLDGLESEMKGSGLKLINVTSAPDPSARTSRMIT